MTDIQIFENKRFGEVRLIMQNNEPWFVGKDVAEILGYEASRNAIAKHVDDEDKLTHQISASGQNRNMTIINESGLYALILSSKLPTAKAFKRWVTSEVLPAIRKTGTYNSKQPTDLQKKRIEIQERNAKVREAALWEKLALTGNDIYKQVCRIYAVNTLAGKEILSLPVADEKTYTATEIGNMLGVSKNKIGTLANANNMKCEAYGKWYHDKSPFSSKEVETFRYNTAGVERFRELVKADI